MSLILYYSNYCDNCKNLLQNLAKNYNSKEIHFICVDKRVQEQEGTYLLLEKRRESNFTTKCYQRSGITSFKSWSSCYIW